MKSQKLKVKSQNYSLKFKANSDLVKTFTLCVIVLSFTFCALPLNEAKAQSLSLSIWPPLVEVMIQPGKTIQQIYKLTNNSDHEVELLPKIVSFEPQGENGEIKFKEAKEQSFFSLGKGYQFSEPFVIGMGESQEIPLQITLPKDNAEKDYYFTLLFTTPNLAAQGPIRSSSVAGLGTNLILTVSRLGKPNFSGKILEFSAPKIIDSFSPIEFTARLENTGNAVWKPFGEIKIEGILEQKGVIRLWEQNILAHSPRQLSLETYRPQLPIGPFRATLKFSINENEEKLQQEIVFWYLPYKLIAGILVIILLVIVVKKIKH